MSNTAEERRSKFWSSVETLKLILRHLKCDNCCYHGGVTEYLSNWHLPTFRSIVMLSSSWSSNPTRIILKTKVVRSLENTGFTCRYGVKFQSRIFKTFKWRPTLNTTKFKADILFLGQTGCSLGNGSTERRSVWQTSGKHSTEASDT